ncbi:MAG: methionine transporter substrate-binding protein [Haloplasmataceae bacterium]|jgi:D-methionine transport system substrate-binding protein|nr:methionine transporter substrate-binding protein [Haloplasmataceae bacterium]
MKKSFLLFNLFLLLIALSACNKKDPNTIYIGASPTPHAEILEFARPLLEEKGYKLDIEILTDYNTPNIAVNNDSLDANYFQHVPYLTQWNTDNDAELVNVGGVHFEPLGIYSKNLSLSNIDNWNNTTVILSKSVTDQLRILKILEKNNLIDLKPNAKITDNVHEAIEANPLNLIFDYENEAKMLTTLYDSTSHTDNTVVCINTNYVLDVKLPSTNRILSETVADASEYVNIIAVQKGNENDPKIKALIEVLQSDEVKQFIEENYLGAVLTAE